MKKRMWLGLFLSGLASAALTAGVCAAVFRRADCSLGVAAWLVLPVFAAAVLAFVTTAALTRGRRGDGLSGEYGAHERHSGGMYSELWEESERLSAVIGNMSEGLLVLDCDRNVIIANAGVAEYLGCQQPSGKAPLADMCSDEQLAECIASAESGESSSCCTELRGRQLQVIATPIAIDGKRMGVVCFILDITEQNQIERMKQEFTANVSHELKTPLTSISGYAEMIETGIARQDDICAFASTIRREAGRLLNLISDIIKLSELDESSGDLTLEPVELLSIARECAETLGHFAQSNNVSVSVEGEPSTVMGSRALISELVYNLCDNAIRYHRENGWVRIEAHGNVLIVTDNGIGIPPEHQARIFERFYRVDKSRSKETGGTGLGLAIVKHIAGQIGAHIELSSSAGNGSRFTIRFAKPTTYTKYN